MKPTLIKCELINIKEREDKNGTEFILKNIETSETHSIKVDESLNRVKQRLSNQHSGNDERDGIYLSRIMANININTNGDKWDINEEDWNYYEFDKKDVERFISK